MGSSLAGRFSRFAGGSVVAFVVSELALTILYGAHILGAAPASVVAFLAGAIPNYVLNRSWVWRRRGPVSMRRELMPYLLVTLVALGVAALATSAAETLAPDNHAQQTLFVSIAYLITYGTLFVAKFVVYEYLIFGDRARQFPPQVALSKSDQHGTGPST